MQSTTFKLTVSKVNELLFQGEVTSVTLPGSEGELTILPYHEPLISMLKAGTITVRAIDKVEKFTIEHGLLETSNGQATILI